MRRLAALAIGLTLVSCGSAADVQTSAVTSSRPAAASATVSPPGATASAGGPTRVPGAGVRITVNGQPLEPGAAGVLAMDGPSTVVLTFPFAMDRASVERWLPRTDSVSWTDDRTVAVTIPPNAFAAGFKVAETRSADGSGIVDLFVVNVAYPPSRALSAYTVGELLAGARVPKDGARRVPLGDRSQATPSPDGRKLLAFGPDVFGGPTIVRVVDVGTRVVATIAPPAGDPPVAVLWMGNDAVVLVGHRVWVEPASGGQPRSVADLASVGTLVAASVSPGGSLLAAASADRLVVVDLATGATRSLAGQHDTCVPSAPGLTPHLAWSADGQRLAVVECDASAAAAKTRFVDVASGRTIATVDGGTAQGWAGLTAFVSGTVGVVRPSGEQGAGLRFLWVVFDFDGHERTRFLARSPQLTPDGRYLIDMGCCVGPSFGVTDLWTSKTTDRGFYGSPYLLHDGTILVLSP